MILNNYYRKFIFLLLFLFSINEGNGQELFRHENSIKQISVDSLGQIIFLDSENNFLFLDHQFDLNSIEFASDSLYVTENFSPIFYDQKALYSFENSNSNLVYSSFDGKPLAVYNSLLLYAKDSAFILQIGNVEKSCPSKLLTESNRINYRWLDSEVYAFNNNSIHKLCSDRKYKLEFELNDLCKINSQLIAGSESKGIWIEAGGVFKKLYYPGIRFPKDIERLEYKDGILWIQRSNKSLLAFDYERQILSSIASDVVDFVLDKWNVLWYISGNSIFKENKFRNSKGADVLIRECTVNGIKQNVSALLSLRQSDKLSLLVSKYYTPFPNKIKVQYKLGENDWINFVDDFSLNLTEAGPTSLSIRAGLGGEYFSYPIHIPIRVKQNIFLSYWPYLFVLLFALFLMSGFAFIWSNLINKKLRRERQELKVKLELIGAQQKLKQMQMSPHFIFNALNALKGLVVLGEVKKASSGIGSFAKLMRTILEDQDKERIPIEEEIDFLHSYLDLEQSIRSFQFDYAIESSISNLLIPPLMVQPFVENAIIHGITTVDSEAKINIVFGESGHYIKVAIEDNGIGFVSSKSEVQTHNSRATMIFTERCQKLDKWKTQEPIRYEKITDNSDRYIGTRCILHIPK